MPRLQAMCLLAVARRHGRQWGSIFIEGTGLLKSNVKGTGGGSQVRACLKPALALPRPHQSIVVRRRSAHAQTVGCMPPLCRLPARPPLGSTPVAAPAE